MDYTPVRDFLIALFIGALVGIERERRKVKEGSEIRGLRSFILIAEAGAVSAWLAVKTGFLWIFPISLIGMILVLMSGYWLAKREDDTAFGLTTEIASVVVFLLAGAVPFGYPETALALAIVASVVLAYKDPLHGLVAKIGTEDLYAILKLLVATFIVLPILPNRSVDPLEALNPYKLWLLVILISSLSLIGYVASRWLGQQRGAAVTGLTGGLVSSTAVTLFFAKSSREEGGVGKGVLTGILLAWAVMFIRVLIEVAVVHKPLVPVIAYPFAAMTGMAAFVAALAYLRKKKEEHASGRGPEVQLKNPFSLTAAIRFAFFFALILVIVKLAQRYLPGAGMYGVAALAGTTDVDAITLSMAKYAQEGGEAAVAAIAITIASLVNTSVKAGIVVMLGAKEAKVQILFAAAAILAAGAAALYFSI
ncbi:MAG TPA: MgtC/SapB family protein [bacterium]|nr:MgtC/SapB family protein [bacterium]